ncbi:MAG: hypothetical protein FWC96_01945 [Oscillospiraceae bacterium]|nr:hypothetical protein [Oscillospiraceae bacterium]
MNEENKNLNNEQPDTSLENEHLEPALEKESIKLTGVEVFKMIMGAYLGLLPAILAVGFAMLLVYLLVRFVWAA